MARGRCSTIPRLAALLLGAAILGACSEQPVSQATETSVPASGQPGTSPSAVPPSDGPAISPDGGSPDGTSVPTIAPDRGIPDKPAKVTFKEVDRADLGGGTQQVTVRLTWSAPDGVADQFLVYGVTRCLREEKAFDGKPCLVKGMRIPKKVQELIATVPGSDRSVDVSWQEGEIGPGPYAAVLIRATNDLGDSIFTIAWSADVCWQCTY
jgi:hypothetical protein